MDLFASAPLRTGGEGLIVCMRSLRGSKREKYFTIGRFF